MAFGEILKQARLERGWTKVYVAERTHMMMKTIEALEAEDGKSFPAPLYGRGFIRQYANLLKIDPQPLIEDYMRHVSDDTYTSPKKEPKQAPTPRKTAYPTVETQPKKTLADRIETAEATPAEPMEEVAPHLPEDDLFAQVAPPAPQEQVETPSETAVSDTPPAPPVNHSVPASEANTRVRKVVTPTSRTAEMHPSHVTTNGSIFSAHQPTKEPPKPFIGFLKAIGKGIATRCAGLVTRATRPKIKPMRGNEGRYGTPRMLYQALLVFLLLLVLTGVILLFRHIFRLSNRATMDGGITPQTSENAEPFELRPVATPPEAFFD